MASPAFQSKRVAPSVTSAQLPAPTGGLNTVSPASAMPQGNCILLYNLIASEFGLRSRLGFQEWATGLEGGTENTVRTMLPFVGSAAAGSENRLFATTQTEIYDATPYGETAPSSVIAFGITTGQAGWGISTVASTPGGRFLLYTDEENGLYIYNQTTHVWAKVSAGTTVLWAPSTTYAVGDKVVNGDKVYVADQAGNSATTGGPTGVGTDIPDGTARWDYVSFAPVGPTIGPSLGDQRAGFTGDPTKFAFVAIWKSRVWFVEKDSTRAWYLDVNAISGTATSFDFGQKMRAGGPLVGLYNWSYDGGAGMDTLLVGISGAGDVVIYQGTDPANAATFGLKGVWFIGGVPAGRRIATDYGGDLLVLSLLGVLPLSKLVIGNAIVKNEQYATANISNLFAQLAANYKELYGWSLCVHPEDKALLITVPQGASQPTIQLAMAFATQGWSRYRDLPLFSCAVWNAQLYFGTVDGRVCVNQGYVDEVKLATPDTYSPVQWSLLSSYQNLGNARFKRVHMVRTNMLSDVPQPQGEAWARYDFDVSEPGAATGITGPIASGTWDAATWDVDVWSGGSVAFLPMRGAAGIGRNVAIAAKGSAIAKTTIVGFEVLLDQGGML